MRFVSQEEELYEYFWEQHIIITITFNTITTITVITLGIIIIIIIIIKT